jgi:hypothetical protein
MAFAALWKVYMNSWTHVAPMELRAWGESAFNRSRLEEVAGKLESVLENTRQERTL